MSSLHVILHFPRCHLFKVALSSYLSFQITVFVREHNWMIVEYLASAGETRRLIYDVWNVSPVIGRIKRSISLQHCTTVLLSLPSWSFAWLSLLLLCFFFFKETLGFAIKRIFFISPLGTLCVTWKRDTLGEKNYHRKVSLITDTALKIFTYFIFGDDFDGVSAVLVRQIMCWRHLVVFVCR